MEEIWKQTQGNKIYLVSNLGNIKSLGHDYIRCDGKRTVTNPGIIKSFFNKANGYVYVKLRINKKQCTFSVHRLVAYSFLNNSLNLSEVNHKNGIKTDNRLENLEWVSKSQNHKHRYQVLNHIPNGKGLFNCGNSKPVIQLDKNGNKIAEFPSTAEAARQLGIIPSSIISVFTGRYKSAGGFKWIRK